AGPRSVSISPMTTCAPSAANRFAVASPMPEHPPVMTATRPSRRPAMDEIPFPVRRFLYDAVLGCSGSGRACGARPCCGAAASGRDEHVLLLGESVGGVGAEFPAEAGLLVAAEGRPVPDGRVRVHRQVAGTHTAGDPQRPADVAGEDGAGQAVFGVVGHGDRLVLVVERQYRDDRAED